MTPIKFSEANRQLLKPTEMSDEDCKPLWVYTDGQQCISCWRPSFWQRLQILAFGRVWLCVLTGQTQPPVWLDGRRSVFQKEAT